MRTGQSITGRSGARLTVLEDRVIKSGGRYDVNEQAMLCLHLGDRVCPRILQVLQHSYAMERLEPLPPMDSDVNMRLLLLRIRTLLQNYVWGRPVLVRDENFGHRAALSMWNRFAMGDERHSAMWRWCHGTFVRLYPQSEIPAHCLTHGDPTISNAMHRVDGSLVLIDPMPPRPHAPPVREADDARLVKSAYGYDSLVEGGVATPVLDPKGFLLSLGEGDYPRRVALWTAVACVRLLEHGYGPQTDAWARATFESMREMVG